MRPECKKYLYDIQKACRLLSQFTSGKTLADYVEDPLLKSGVERQFEVIGEALNQMLRLDRGLADAITDPKRIIAFRNILVHGYAIVSDEVVWGILETNLATLQREVRALLEEVGP